MSPRLRSATVVFAVAFAAHLPALWNGFTWLDHGDLEQGAALAPLGQAPSLFARPYARTSFYRPVTALTFSVDAAWSGTPLGYHLTNLLLHAAAAVLVLLLAEALGLSTLAALLAALLFGVHTSTSLVANQLTYRGEALLLGALCLTLLGQVRQRAALTLVGVLLGCFSKETTFVLAPALMAALWPWHRPTRTVAGAAAVSLAMAAAARFAVALPWRPTAPPLEGMQWLGTHLAVLGLELRWLVWPWRGMLCDAVPISTLASLGAAAGALALVVAGLAAWRWRPFGLLALVSAAPMLNLVPLPRMASPHYVYVPLAFLAMGLAGWSAQRRWSAVASSVLIAALAVSSVLDSQRYRDDTALFTREVAEGPQCREAHLYLGDALRLSGALEDAAARYTVAASPSAGFVSYSDEGAALTNLGVTRMAQERPADALQPFTEAFVLPADALEHRHRLLNLSAVHLELGQFAEVEGLLREEATRPDVIPEALELLAHAVGAQGREAEAQALMQRARAAGLR